MLFSLLNFILYQYKFFNLEIFSNNSLLYNILYYFNFLKYNYLILYLIIYSYLKNSLLLSILLLNNTNLTLWFSYYYNICLPQTLIYGFNLIHPIFFYITLIIFNIYLISISYNKIKIKINYIVGCLALVFGMYWGGINEIWGFFWTYDKVEVALLFLLLIIFFFIHTNKLLSNFWIIILLYIYLLNYLVLLRYNIIFTVHSFFIVKQVKFILFFEKICLAVLYFNFKFNVYILFIGFILCYICSYFFVVVYEIYYLNKIIWLFHIFLFTIVLLIVFPSYYYIIFNSKINYIFNNFNIFYSYINSIYFFLENTLIIYSLNFVNSFNYFYLTAFTHIYNYYLGYLYLILGISFVKIYI